MHVENSDPMIEPPEALNWAKRPSGGHRDCYQSYTNKKSLEQIADDAGTQLEITTLRAVTATWKMKTQQQNHAACRRIGQACQQDTCTRRTTDAFLQLQLVHFLSQTLVLSERERHQLCQYLMFEACEAMCNAVEMLGDERISLDLLPWTGAPRRHRKRAAVPRFLLCLVHHANSTSLDYLLDGH